MNDLVDHMLNPDMELVRLREDIRALNKESVCWQNTAKSLNDKNKALEDSLALAQAEGNTFRTLLTQIYGFIHPFMPAQFGKTPNKDVKLKPGLKYIVLKVDDLDKYAPFSLALLRDIEEEVRKGRNKEGKPTNQYIVINEDEPYSGTIKDLLRLFGQNLSRPSCIVPIDKSDYPLCEGDNIHDCRGCNHFEGNRVCASTSSSGELNEN